MTPWPEIGVTPGGAPGSASVGIRVKSAEVLGFLLRRLVYLLVLVIISTSAAYLLAATQLNPRSRYEGRNPPPPAAVVDAALDAVNMNDKTPLSTTVRRAGPAALSTAIWAGPSTTRRSTRRSAAACGSACGCCCSGRLLGTLLGVAAGAYSAVKQHRPRRSCPDGLLVRRRCPSRSSCWRCCSRTPASG